MLKIRVISEIREARRIWDELSSCNNIYEDWDFRYIFFRQFNEKLNYSLKFYIGEEDGRIIGFLPLQYNSIKGYLEFFGGTFMEDNHVFIKPGYERHVPEFYGAIKEKAMLDDIVIDNGCYPLEFMENKYIIDLKGLNNLDDYLGRTFRPKRVKRFKKMIEDIGLLRPKVRENDYRDLETLIDLNVKSFKKESYFYGTLRRDIFRDLVKSKFDVVTMSAEINGKKESASFGIKYKDAFVSMNSGTNKKEFPDLGSYMILKRIEKAISLGCETFDAGLENLGWKEKWHLQRIPEYKFHYGF